MKIAVAAIVKNESEGLLEWIAFHRVVGIGHFIIADNASTDGTRECLAALSAVGIVTLIDYPTRGEQKPQLPAYSTILAACPGDIDVLGFVDADEFLLPLDGSSSILPFAERLFAVDDVSAVALNWANFGSSGRLFCEEGLVIERFAKRAKQTFNANHHYKSLVRPQRVSFFENPHHAQLRAGRYVDARGNDLIKHAKHGNGLCAEVIWEGARVNHYAVKSLEEFVLGKSRKGSATKHGRIKHKAYFVGHDKNEEDCLLAKNLAPLVRAELARIEALIRPALSSDKRSSTRVLGWLSRGHSWLGGGTR